VSLGPRASAILRWSANMAKRLNAGLSVIHTSKALESNSGLSCNQEWRYWLKKMARDEIRSLQAGLGTDAEVWLESGKAVAAIPPLADHLRADLLVIGKNRKSVSGLSADAVLRVRLPDALSCCQRLVLR
jgi:hypothetical protein